MRVGAAWRHFEWNILPPFCGSINLVSYERFVQNSDSTWTTNVHRPHCRCPNCSTYTYHSFCRRFIDDETFVFLHGACYRVSGIVPLCLTLMRPFNVIKLLWSGKYKRTHCILHTSLRSALQLHKELDSSSDWAPGQSARTDIPPPHPTPVSKTSGIWHPPHSAQLVPQSGRDLKLTGRSRMCGAATVGGVWVAWRKEAAERRAAGCNSIAFACFCQVIFIRVPVKQQVYCAVHKLCVSFSSTTFFSNSFPREKYLGKLRSKSAHTKIGTEQTTLL